MNPHLKRVSAPSASKLLSARAYCALPAGRYPKAGRKQSRHWPASNHSSIFVPGTVKCAATLLLAALRRAASARASHVTLSSSFQTTVADYFTGLPAHWQIIGPRRRTCARQAIFRQGNRPPVTIFFGIAVSGHDFQQSVTFWVIFSF